MAAVLALSCGKTGTAGLDMLPYVREVIADTASLAHSAVAGYDHASRTGTIAVTGPAHETMLITEYLMECDIYDNVDARSVSDSLPDFAGEVFAAYYDSAEEPYYNALSDGDDSRLRELTVRNTVAAVSPLYYLNQFCPEPTVGKIPSKIIIYSSSFSDTGIPDVDTLFRSFGKNVRTVSPVRAIAGQLHERNVTGRVGIWADSDVLASGVYAGVFHGCDGIDYVGFSPEESSDAESGFIKFLDMYLSTGDTTPLSAIVIDGLDLSFSAGNVILTAERIMSSKEDEFAVYRDMLTDDFVVIDAVSSIARTCYAILRNDNTFAHRISYPKEEEYMTVRSPEGDVKYIEFNHLYVH